MRGAFRDGTKLAPALRFINPKAGLSKRRWSMETESAFFYFVLLTLLIVVLNALLSKSHRRDDRHSHV